MKAGRLESVCQICLPEPVQVAVPEFSLKRRIAELARRISADFEGREVVLVTVLKGAQFFACDLARALTIPLLLEFVTVRGFGESGAAGGIALLQDVRLDLQGKSVLLVEDIVDTGLTLKYLLRNFQPRGAREIRVCTLLDRPALRLADVRPDYVGFEVGSEFLVGYGLDFRGRFRNLPYIAALATESSRSSLAVGA